MVVKGTFCITFVVFSRKRRGCPAVKSGTLSSCYDITRLLLLFSLSEAVGFLHLIFYRASVQMLHVSQCHGQSQAEILIGRSADAS